MYDGVINIISSGYVSYSDMTVFFFQAEDGIRDLVRSRGLGDVYKRQALVAHVGSGHRQPKILPKMPRSSVSSSRRLGSNFLSLIHI